MFPFCLIFNHIYFIIIIIFFSFSRFYLKLLKVKKYRQDNRRRLRLRRNGDGNNDEDKADFSFRKSKCSIYFFLFSLLFGMIGNLIFLVMAQEYKKDHPGEKNFLYSFTLSSLFLLLPLVGMIELFVHLIGSCVYRILYISCVIFILPSLRFDDYVKGSHAYYFIPISLCMLGVLCSMCYNCYEGKCSCLGFINAIFELCLVVWYVWYIILLDSLVFFCII